VIFPPRCLLPLLASLLATVPALADEQAGRPQRHGPAPPTISVTESMLDRGKAIYESRCTTCHGRDGAGLAVGGQGPEMTPPDLRDAGFMASRSDMDFANIIQHGGFRMPAFPQVRGDDLVALVARIRSFSWPQIRSVDLQLLAQGTIDDFQPVTRALLEDPPDDDWLMFRRTYDGWAYSPLDQVNEDNVGELRLAWSRAMEPGGQYTTPLVHAGIMYVQHPGDVIQALDATNGDLIWEYRRQRDDDSRSRNRRNLAIYGHRLFHLTDDRHLIALDARDGALLWETEEWGSDAGISHMGGPMVAAGVVVSGRSCSARGGPDICYLAGHDPETGRELWRRRTIPRPGEPGDDSWGDLPDERRWHVGSWGNVPSYDPVLGLLYWGTSVPSPSLEQLRGTTGRDVLYSNSTLATDPLNGEVAWYYQHLPRDNWDLDHVFERYLIDVAVAPDPAEVPWISPRVTPGERRSVVTGIPGKTGIVYTLDRKTGEFLWARETLHQNVVTSIDGNGEVHINEDLVVGPFEEILVCPSLGGGKNWAAGSYSPLTGLMYQPQQNMCVLQTGNTDTPTAEDGYAISWIVVEDPAVTSDPYPVGRIDAIDISTGRQAWRHEQRAAVIGTAVSTAGGLLFVGDINRRFMAFDDSTGELLWQTIVSAPVSGSAISYAVGGRQYIAVAVGGGTASPERRALSIHTELKPPRDSPALFVFALPAR